MVSTLPSFCWSYKIQDKEATVTVLAVMAVSVVTATPLKLNPPFPSSRCGSGTMLRIRLVLPLEGANFVGKTKQGSLPKVSFHRNHLSLESPSETWLVHTKVCEPHLNPLVRILENTGERWKVSTNCGVQLWFANFSVNQASFRLDCRKRF